MTTSHVKYLVIGGGLAASSAVQEIRRHDPHSAVLLVGQEVHRPYHRPPLSKELLRGSMNRNELFTLEPEWFRAHEIELRTGRRAVNLDAPRHFVALDNGEEIAFDKLLLATGGSARHLTIPGADLPNAFYLRSIDDAHRLQLAIEKARVEGHLQTDRTARGKAVIVGAGLLGVELAGSLSLAGIEVALVASQSHPWDRFAGDSTGRFVMQFLEDNGVSVHTNVQPLRFEGDGRVQRVVLGDNSVLPCDFVVSAVGMIVNKELLRGTSITSESAILVDATCRTNLLDIYAAGDCAAIFDPLFGKHRMLDHWESALTTGKIAGSNMAGVPMHYDTVNTFWTRVFDLPVYVYGEAKQVERRLVRETGSTDSPQFLEFGIAPDGRIVQIIAVGDETKRDELLQLNPIAHPGDGNEEQFRDPAVALDQLAKR